MNKDSSVARDWFDVCRRVLFVILFVAGAIALFYAEENWRGARKWRQYRAELESKGENVDWAKLVPTRPPDSENVMMVPEMDRWFVKGRTNAEADFFSVVPKKTGENKQVQLATVRIAPNQPVITQEAFYDHVAPKRLRTGANLLLYTAPAKMPEIALDQSVTNLSEWLRIGNNSKTIAGPVSVEALSSNTFAVYAHDGDWISAEDYLKWSAQFEPQLAIIRDALKRPAVWIDGDYSIGFRIPIPNFIHSRVFAQFLAARAEAFILLHRPEEALEQIKLLENFNRIMIAPPLTLVAAMINVAIHGLILNTIEEGFAEHVWTESQCGEIQNLFKSVNLIQIVVDGFRMERPAVASLVEKSAFGDLGKSFNWIPRGWVDLNLVNYLKISEASIDWPDAPNRLIAPALAAAAQAKVMAQISTKSPFMTLAQIAIPNVGKASQTAAKNQDLLHQALIASALERFHFQNGKYPESLAEITPNFIDKIPHDVVTGGPMRYQKRGHGYVLYSVGWDLKDDSKELLADERVSVADIFGNPIVNRDWLWRGVPTARADFE
jgi:hypothetical protein